MSFFRDIYPRLCMKILLSYRSQFSRPRLSRIGTSTGPYSAAHALTRNSKVETEDDVGEMLRSLRSRSIAWARPGSAQFDFRSDVVTTPTLPMLHAIIQTTLLDDVYQEDPTTISLERHVAALSGHSAGVFAISGTMANQIALRALLDQPPHAILCDSRAHIIHWEAGGIASLCGAMVQGVPPSNGEYLTLEDIQQKVVLSDDVHKCPTRVIALENTISGLVHPLPEIRKISQWVRKNGLKLHLDGARLWEATAAGAGDIKAYAECFDSVSLDFSKGLGAPMGAMIVGDRDFVARARRIRKSVGGGMRQAGVLSAAARAALDNASELGEVHILAKQVARMWTEKGGKLLKRVETNIVWVDLKDAGIRDEAFQEIGRKNGIKVDGSRLVLHYQISDAGIQRLERTFDEALAGTNTKSREAESPQ